MTPAAQGDEGTRYVRWQAAQPNRHGRHPGIFALANGLARDGLLIGEDWRWWRASNDWFNDAYANPVEVCPDVYDPGVNPEAVAWFKSGALHLLERVSGYLSLLDRYGVEYESSH